MAQAAFAFRNKAYEICLETLSRSRSEEATEQVEDPTEVVERVESAEKSNTRNRVIVAFVLTLISIIITLAVVFSLKGISEGNVGKTLGSKYFGMINF